MLPSIGSIELDARFADHLAPGRVVLVHLRGELRRTAAHRCQTLHGEGFLQRRLVHDPADFAAQPVDDLGRHAGNLLRQPCSYGRVGVAPQRADGRDALHDLQRSTAGRLDHRRGRGDRTPGST